jgi:hypothetical protein
VAFVIIAIPVAGSAFFVKQMVENAKNRISQATIGQKRTEPGPGSR